MALGSPDREHRGAIVTLAGLFALAGVGGVVMKEIDPSVSPEASVEVHTDTADTGIREELIPSSEELTATVSVQREDMEDLLRELVGAIALGEAAETVRNNIQIQGMTATIDPKDPALIHLEPADPASIGFYPSITILILQNDGLYQARIEEVGFPDGVITPPFIFPLQLAEYLNAMHAGD